MIYVQHGRNPNKDIIDDMPDLNIAYDLVKWSTPPEKKAVNEIYYPVVIVKVPLYRLPERTLSTFCLPLLLLNIMALCGFSLEDSDLHSNLSM